MSMFTEDLKLIMKIIYEMDGLVVNNNKIV